MNLELLREWVKAEIEYAIADNEEDEEGYRGSAYIEKEEADKAFKKLSDSQFLGE